jgi:hypothetical protein
VIDYGLYDSDTSGRRKRFLVRSSRSLCRAVTHKERLSIDETLRSTKEAIEAHLMALKEDRVAAPVEESLFIGRVQVEVAE